MSTDSPTAYDFASASARGARISSGLRNARTPVQAKYAITAAPTREMYGSHVAMLPSREWAITESVRKTVSAVVAPAPTRNPALQDRVTVRDAMIAFTRPGGAPTAQPIANPAPGRARGSRAPGAQTTDPRSKPPGGAKETTSCSR